MTSRATVVPRAAGDARLPTSSGGRPQAPKLLWASLGKLKRPKTRHWYPEPLPLVSFERVQQVHGCRLVNLARGPYCGHCDLWLVAVEESPDGGLTFAWSRNG